jgi:midasin (ATPase involved in ribosome maturation)
MENTSHKGTEFNNVQETWNQNERNLQNGTGAGSGSVADETAPKNELEELIRQEATEYDNANKEDRILDGDRATVNDEDTDVSKDV